MNEDILIDFSYQIHDGWDLACVWLYIVFENGSAKGERDLSTLAAGTLSKLPTHAENRKTSLKIGLLRSTVLQNQNLGRTKLN